MKENICNNCYYFESREPDENEKFLRVWRGNCLSSKDKKVRSTDPACDQYEITENMIDHCFNQDQFNYKIETKGRNVLICEIKSMKERK